MACIDAAREAKEGLAPQRRRVACAADARALSGGPVLRCANRSGGGGLAALPDLQLTTYNLQLTSIQEEEGSPLFQKLDKLVVLIGKAGIAAAVVCFGAMCTIGFLINGEEWQAVLE